MTSNDHNCPRSAIPACWKLNPDDRLTRGKRWQGVSNAKGALGITTLDIITTTVLILNCRRAGV